MLLDQCHPKPHQHPRWSLQGQDLRYALFPLHVFHFTDRILAVRYRSLLFSDAVTDHHAFGAIVGCRQVCPSRRRELPPDTDHPIARSSTRTVPSAPVSSPTSSVVM